MPGRTSGRGRTRGGGRTRDGVVRPTAQRVREALYNSLGARVAGREVLDLFAGTGALGLEALRRGARRAIFIERDPRLAGELRARLDAEGLREIAEVWRSEVRAALRRLAEEGRTFDLVLLDPPYGRGLLQETLDALGEGPLLAADALVVAEGHWRDAPRVPTRFVLARDAKYGETTLWFFTLASGHGGDLQPVSGAGKGGS